MTDILELLIPCAKGTEKALKFELKDLGLRDPKGQDGAVSCTGLKNDVGLINVMTRIGHRVLIKLHEFEAGSIEEVTEELLKFPYEQYIAKKCTFAIRAHLVKAPQDHSLHMERVIKDTVVDRFRELARERPMVDKKMPAVRLVFRWEKQRARLYLDTSGRALSHRGYRPPNVRAPLRESLAAALLSYGYADPERPFHDPCCGSGTIAIEHAWRSMKRAPGIDRRFAIDRWPGDAYGYLHGLELARERAKDELLEKPQAPIFLSDWHREAILFAEESVAAAGLSEWLVPVRVDARRAEYSDDRPVIFSNLPYGDRLSQNVLQLDGFYRGLGETMASLPGARVCFFTNYRGTEKLLNLGAPARKWSLNNGPNRVQLRRWDIKSAE